jgi:hypothetical protein
MSYRVLGYLSSHTWRGVLVSTFLLSLGYKNEIKNEIKNLFSKCKNVKN